MPVPAIAILGPGGVGGFLAAALDRANEDVLVIARRQTAQSISRQGIELRSARLGDFRARPRAAEALSDPVEVLLVATKAMGLEDALRRIEAEPQVVVPLLNGLDHMPLLRRRFGSAHVAAGAIRIESDRPAPGLVVQSSPFLRVDLAADQPQVRKRLAQVADALTRASVPVEIRSSEAQVLWSKLVRLNALALTTSATGRRLEFIRSDREWRAALEACIAEAAAVADADGAQIDPAAPIAELEDAHPELGSSMQRDIAAGRETELDAIAGSVLRAAARHGLQCPTIERLAAQVARRAGTAA